MTDCIWVGLDVHKETICAVGVGQRTGQVVERKEIRNSAVAVKRLVRELRRYGEVRFAYEAGPCGYEVKRQMDDLGVECMVAAPALIWRKPGDRVKTDRRDAEKLARLLRMGELTSVDVPSPEREALRDLIRGREDALEELGRSRHRLGKFLLRHGRRFEGRSWTLRHWAWLREQRFGDGNEELVFEEYVLAVQQGVERLRRMDVRIKQQSTEIEDAAVVARLRTLRGVDTLTAMTLAAELGDLRRFSSARQLMAYVGLVPSERSSGRRERRGSITKTGNAHVRRVLVESAWHARHSPTSMGGQLRARRAAFSPQVVELARKADLRLHRKFMKMVGKGKDRRVAAVAVARELVGFVWSLATLTH